MNSSFLFDCLSRHFAQMKCLYGLLFFLFIQVLNSQVYKVKTGSFSLSDGDNFSYQISRFLKLGMISKTTFVLSIEVVLNFLVHF